MNDSLEDIMANLDFEALDNFIRSMPYQHQHTYDNIKRWISVKHPTAKHIDIITMTLMVENILIPKTPNDLE